MALVENDDLTPVGADSDLAAEMTAREAEASLKQLILEVNALGSLLRQGSLTEGHGSGLAGGESAILDLLDRLGAQSVPQMARLRSTSRQNIQVAVNRLGREHSVEFAANPAHKRSRLVQITEAGRKRLGAAREQERLQLQRLADHFRVEQLGSAAALLRAVRLGLAGEQAGAPKLATARSGKPMNQPAKIVPAQNSPSPAVVAEWESLSGELPVNLL